MRRGVLALVLCATLVASACTRTDQGVPTSDGERRAATATYEMPTSETDPPDPQEGDEPGVVPTMAPGAAGTVCAPPDLPPVRTVAQISDPAAPTATVGVPDGWSMSSGGGDPVGARLEGPSGMRATVTIAATSLAPAAAFRRYSDDLTEDSVVSTVSLLPGEMCGYSGQQLMGILSDGTDTVQYEDRLVHVPAPAQDYLIAIHVEAPSDTPGFEDAASLVTGDFEIGLP
ncbi:MAG: hypothetical protein WBB00_19995 [Mycobacterium sp.]